MANTSHGRPMLRLFLGSFLFATGLVLMRICMLARRSTASDGGSAWSFCLGAALCLGGLLLLIWPVPKRRRET